MRWHAVIVHRVVQTIAVCGYHEEATTTTRFDKVVLNRLDRFELGFGQDLPETRGWRWKTA